MVKQKQPAQVLSYAETVRMKMKTADNPTGEQLSIREAARRIGYSYEHVRKVYNGEPVVSPEFNSALCSLLGLSSDEMWRVAKREKLQHRYGVQESEIQLPKDKRLAVLIEQMTDDERKELQIVAEGILLSRSAKAAYLSSYGSR